MIFKRLIIFITIFIAIIFLQSIPLFAIGINPLVIELSAKPGDTVPFTITIIPAEKPEVVTLFLAKFTQQPNGGLSFEEVNPSSYPPANWVSFPSKVNVGIEKIPISGTIKVPLNAVGGTYNLALMMDSESPVKGKNLNVRIRFGVRFHLRVDWPGLRPSVQLDDFNIVKGEQGEPVIQTLVKNTSPIDFLFSATVTIRNNQKKLIERVEIKPKVSWEIKALETRMFPNGELLYVGNPKEALLPGDYELRLFYRYGTAGQIVKSKIINIKAGEYIYPKSKLKVVKISPTNLEFSGKPGTSSLKALKFENFFDKSLFITVETVDFSQGYNFSILKNTEVEIKGGKQFTLEPGRMYVDIISVKFPKDAPVHVNYGLIKINVYLNDPNPTLIEDSVILLSAAVPGDYKLSAEVTNLLNEFNGDKYLLAAVVKNNGNVKICPTATAFIKNEEGKEIDTVKLAVEGDDNAFVYPDKVLTLTGFSEKLKSGKYYVVIKVNDGQKEIGTSELNLIVK